MTNYFNKKEISQRAEDELLYEYVMEEMEQEPNFIKGLWAKAMAHSEGNNDKAKSLYMQYRVQSIKDDFKLLDSKFIKILASDSNRGVLSLCTPFYPLNIPPKGDKIMKTTKLYWLFRFHTQ